VLEKLEQLIDEIGALNNKLVLLIGPPNAGKTALLHSLAKNKGVMPLNVGAELGGRLAGMPLRQRHLQTTTFMRELADQHAPGDLLLLDNIELLFDRSVQVGRRSAAFLEFLTAAAGAWLVSAHLRLKGLGHRSFVNG